MTLRITGEGADVDGDPIATESDVEELERQVRTWRRRTWLWRALSVAFSAVTFVLGTVL